MADDDEVPQLSAHSLAALQEFYAEQQEQQQQLIDAKQGDMKDVDLKEDWVRFLNCKFFFLLG